jgi:hypothetical protein
MATIKRKPNGKIITINGKVSCRCCYCILDGPCTLTFIYRNVNEIQDDVWDIELFSARDGWVYAGTIDGTCDAYDITGGDCDCTKVDVRTFTFTIDQSFISESERCAIEFRSILVTDNECGTFGTFDIIGPKGEGFGGFLGDNGFINVEVACFLKDE